MYEIYISYNPFDDQYILIYCTADCRPMCVKCENGKFGDAPRKYGQSGNPGNPGNLNLNPKVKVSYIVIWRILFTAIELYYSSKYPLPATTKYTLVISTINKMKI